MSNLAAVKILQDLRANGLDLGFEKADYAAMDTAIEALSAFGVVIGRNTDSDGTDVFIVRTSTGETEYFVRATPASTKKRVDKLRETATPAERTPQRGGDAVCALCDGKGCVPRLAGGSRYCEACAATVAGDGELPSLDDAGVFAARLGGLAMSDVLRDDVREMLCHAAYIIREQRAALSASAARSGGDAENGHA